MRPINATPSQAMSLRRVLKSCAHAAIVLMVTMLPVGRASAQTDSWATKTPDPNLIWGPSAVSFGGKIYVHGFNSDAAGNQASFTPRLSIYSPSTDTWAIGAPPPIIRAGSDAGEINGKMYVVGGCVM